MKLFKDLPRNNSLRDDVLKRFISGTMTDDERAELYELPEGCRIREGAKIISLEKFKCGKYVWIGENAVLDASGGLEIGDHTSIGLSVFVWSHTSYLANLSMGNFFNSPLIERKPTKIGSGCFIGGPSVIYHNVTIGNKVVVLPMSVVSVDVPDFSIIGGSPAKIIRTLTEKEIEEKIHKESSRILLERNQ